jgi:PAS domain-containing protein
VTSGAAELEQLLTDLGRRRTRISSLASTHVQDEGLLQELAELGERLQVADEELRVQQEELEAARLRLREESADRELLATTVPSVRTDPRGHVLTLNLAAARLTQRSTARGPLRPLAGWFVVQDRPAVRDLVTRAVRHASPASAPGLRLTLPDGSEVVTAVEVEPEARDDGSVSLLWRFRGEVQDAPLDLRPLRDLVAEDLASLALDLARHRGATDVLTAVADALVRLVPGATQVAVSVLRRDVVELTAAAGPGAADVEAWQLAVGEGPAVAAASSRGTAVVVDDLAAEPRWPHLRVVEERHGLVSTVSVAASLPTVARTLVLSWYGTSRAAFAAEEGRRRALLAAAHAAAAVDRAVHEEHLEAAIAHRQLIGEAVGMVAARESLGREAAFALLAQLSQRSNRKLVDLARDIAESHG